MKIVTTPECPVCGSFKTGYYVIGTDNWSVKEQHFRRGERIRFIPFPSTNNCYCCNCGMKWKGRLIKQHFSRLEFQTYLLEHDFISERDIVLKKREFKHKLSKEEKEILKKKKLSAIQLILLIITGIDLRKKEETERK